MPQFSNFSQALIQWYSENKRNLPWRKTKDPYIIWVSEIILQQTRVQQGISYFERFIQRFPNIEELAKANEQDVLRLWQGLGYYSRARNMHSTSKIILENYDGEFPKDYKSILSLKGIGEYTAAAISSFAYKMPYAVIDGNVIRVLSRLYGIEENIESTAVKKWLKEKANELIDKKEPDTYNQAIMEFGALHCTPSNTDCPTCPFSKECIAYNAGKVNSIPFKKKANSKKNRYFDYAVLRKDDKIFVHKRLENDIWKNLYDFPMLENIGDLLKEEKGNYELSDPSQWFIHILSHQKIHARFHEIKIKKVDFKVPDNWEMTELKKIGDYPLPKLIESYINDM